MRRDIDSTMGTGIWRAGRRALWGLVLLAWVPARTAPASPIRHHHQQLATRNQIATRSAGESRGWGSFLAGGPGLWSRAQPPTIGTPIHRLMMRGLESSDPVADPNVQYLLWRRSLDPPRFDHWHPRIGPMLQALLPPSPSPSLSPSTLSPAPEAEHNGPATSTVPPAFPPPPSSSTTPTVPASPALPTTPSSTTPPEIITPPPSAISSPAPIPEPETLTMALVLIGSGLWWRFRNGLAPVK